MPRILFVCHGNICRSPMAEFILKHLVSEAAKSAKTPDFIGAFEIASAAVSAEETGNDIYPPAKRILTGKGIPFSHHAARRMTQADYDYYDYIICMDQSNLRWLNYIIGSDRDHKVSLLMQWIDGQWINGHIVNGQMTSISDPWYTGDFETAYNDIYLSCQSLLKHFIANNE